MKADVLTQQWADFVTTSRLSCYVSEDASSYLQSGCGGAERLERAGLGKVRHGY